MILYKIYISYCCLLLIYIKISNYIIKKYINNKKLEQAGIDPAASCMLSMRSTI